MSAHAFSHDAFQKLPLIGILRGFDTEHAIEIALAAMQAGLTTLEVAMNTRAASEQIEALVRATNGGMNIGAGTVTSEDRLQAALDAGASYIVMPTAKLDLIRRCTERSIPVFPGAVTPTEIEAAWAAGAAMVKLFPADHFGPSYIKSVKAPLDGVKILATGGVTLANAPDYLRAGADGFGLGSPLFSRERMDSRDWDWLAKQVREFGALLESAHGSYGNC